MADVRSEVVLITGATDGLGKAVAFALAHPDRTLLVHGRNRERVDALVTELLAKGALHVRGYVADFSDLKSVRGLASEILRREKHLNVLINNAGVGILDTRTQSADGYELTFQVNFLAGDLLSRALSGLLRRSAPSKILNISSAGQWPLDAEDLLSEENWNGAIAYGRSKLAQIMGSFDFAAEYAGEDVVCNAIHPASLMPTKIVLGKFQPASTIEHGVRNVLNILRDRTGATGCFFYESELRPAHAQAYDPAMREYLRSWVDSNITESVERVA